jgi:hypothetical protein
MDDEIRIECKRRIDIPGIPFTGMERDHLPGPPRGRHNPFRIRNIAGTADPKTGGNHFPPVTPEDTGAEGQAG